MATSGWTDEELRATMVAYLDMMQREEAGQPVNKSAIRRDLVAGPLMGRSEASVELRMRNISYVMEQLGLTRIRGYLPAANVGSSVAPRLEAIVNELSGATQGVGVGRRELRPLYSPRPANPARILQPTGYWTFQVNPTRWDAFAWLAEDENELLYLVSEDDDGLVQPGDLALMRVNVFRGKPAQIVAILEVIEETRRQPDPDKRFYRSPEDGQAALRTKLRVIANLGARPIPVDLLPDADEFKYLRRSIQRSSVALSPVAFDEVARIAGVDGEALRLQRAAQDAAGARRLEAYAASLTPAERQRVSKYIERGSNGMKVKAARQGRCQICEGLGHMPVAFVKANGEPYSEAHHVMPVSRLATGSLAATNIMVLCPNHHREAHHGAFEVLAETAVGWTVQVGGRRLQVDKTSI